MDLFEYQAKELFAAHGVPVLPGVVASTAERGARAAAEALGTPVVVKAQVKTGGRGKAGGVKFAATADEAAEQADAILGMDIKGHTVHRVLVTAGQRHRRGVLRLVPARPGQPHVPLRWPREDGGMEIEQLAVERPEALAMIPVDALAGVDNAKAAEIATAGRFPEDVRDQVVDVLEKLWVVFRDEDATLVEVNPLVRTPDGQVDRPRRQGHPRRQRRLPAPRPRGVRRPRRHRPARAARQGEAPQLRQARTARSASSATAPGLVMSTLDVVAYAGEDFGGVSPANFLDIGGGASAEVMANGLDIVLNDPDVRAVFVNVFGGITACDAVANGIVAAFALLEEQGEDDRASRWSCGSTATTPRRVDASSTRPRCTASSSSTRWTELPAGWPSWPRRPPDGTGTTRWRSS